MVATLQRVDVRTFIVLSICNGRFQYTFLTRTAAFFRAEGQQVQSLVNRTDHVLDQLPDELSGQKYGRNGV